MASAFAHGSSSKNHRLYIGLAAVFVSSLLVGDLIGGKFVRVFGHHQRRHVRVPVTFVMTDIINGFYGKKGARFVTLVAMMMVIYAFIILQLAIGHPSRRTRPSRSRRSRPCSASGWCSSCLAHGVLDRPAVTSTCSYLRGITASKHLWLRATGSHGHLAAGGHRGPERGPALRRRGDGVRPGGRLS
ncbi:MAG: VUT family protein [Sandaracinaceae bacterium]|nr:VUT family protein [Sandaracinaceae bacterium]